MFNRVSKGLALLVLSLSAGCSTLEPYIESYNINRHNRALHHYTPLTAEKDGDKEPFSLLYSGLRKNIKKIYLIDQKDFEAPSVRGHNHANEWTICLPKEYSLEKLTHEAFHVKKNALDQQCSDFSSRWKETSQIEYGSLSRRIMIGRTVWSIEWLDGGEGPENSCLAPYGGESIEEDIATYGDTFGYLDKFDKVAKYLSGFHGEGLKIMANSESTLYPLFFCDPNDPRYLSKIDLLREYDFISEEQHQIMRDRCGKLNGLLTANEEN